MNDFISRQWAVLENLLKHAFMVSIFGYGAPVSDASAVALLKKAWGSTDSRSMSIFQLTNESEIA